MQNRNPPPPAMQNPSPANQPTSPAKQSRWKRLCCPTCPPCVWTIAHLGPYRLILKILQMLLSLAALIVQARLEYHTISGGQIFFSCVSCFGFLLCFPFLALYCTSLYEIVTEYHLKMSDLWLAVVVGLSFPLASYLLIRTYDGKSDQTGAMVLGLLAGLAFVEDALMLCCNPWNAERKRQEENTNRPLNPTGNQPPKYQPV